MPIQSVFLAAGRVNSPRERGKVAVATVGKSNSKPLRPKSISDDNVSHELEGTTGGERRTEDIEEEIGEIERLQKQVEELARPHIVQEECEAPMVRNPMRPQRMKWKNTI